MMMMMLSTIYDDDDDFIDMNVCFPSSSPLPKLRRISREEFEFQIMSSSSSSSFINSTYADELFHHGKLLPLLHLKKPNYQQTLNPPCLAGQETKTLPHVIPSILAANTETLAGDEDYCFFEWSNDDIVPHRLAEKRSENWSKRIYHKALTAAKKCLRPLFVKPTICGVYSRNPRKKLPLSAKKDDEAVLESHQRSFAFSGPIFSSSSSSSTSSSSSSSSPTPTKLRSSLPSLNIDKPDSAAFEKLRKRSSSARFEGENSIDGAIAYCKRSHAL